MEKKLAFRFAAVFGFFGVALGAFGAHGLKAVLSDSSALATWETGVRYQMVHALVLLLAVLFQANKEIHLLKRSTLFFTLGIICFSGSLYLLSIRSLVSFNLTWLGPITPIGGLFFLIGWAYFFLSASTLFGSKTTK